MAANGFISSKLQPAGGFQCSWPKGLHPEGASCIAHVHRGMSSFGAISFPHLPSLSASVLQNATEASLRFTVPSNSHRSCSIIHRLTCRSQTGWLLHKCLLCVFTKIVSDGFFSLQTSQEPVAESHICACCMHACALQPWFSGIHGYWLVSKRLVSAVTVIIENLPHGFTLKSPLKGICRIEYWYVTHATRLFSNGSTFSPWHKPLNQISLQLLLHIGTNIPFQQDLLRCISDNDWNASHLCLHSSFLQYPVQYCML